MMMMTILIIIMLIADDDDDDNQIGDNQMDEDHDDKIKNRSCIIITISWFTSWVGSTRERKMDNSYDYSQQFHQSHYQNDQNDYHYQNDHHH